VLQAYGFNPDDDLLEDLLTLNLELAEKEKRERRSLVFRSALRRRISQTYQEFLMAAEI